METPSTYRDFDHTPILSSRVCLQFVSWLGVTRGELTRKLRVISTEIQHYVIKLN